MKNRSWTIAVSVVIAFVVGLWGMQRSSAQVPGFKRTELQKHDLSTAGHEAVVTRGEFQPGAVVPKHSHPGEELAFVLEGEVVIEMEGKPAATMKAGDTFFVPAGTVHSAKNASKKLAVVISTYVVEKDKPLVTMVK
jgi:quercetin dioxygenase-like cupin family protein